jgi:hypothetical protein
MVSARMEMLQPVVARSALRPQGAGLITFAREEDGCGEHLRRPARQAPFLRARRKIDEPLTQLPGWRP